MRWPSILACCSPTLDSGVSLWPINKDSNSTQGKCSVSLHQATRLYITQSQSHDLAALCACCLLFLHCSQHTFTSIHATTLSATNCTHCLTKVNRKLDMSLKTWTLISIPKRHCPYGGRRCLFWTHFTCRKQVSYCRRGQDVILSVLWSDLEHRLWIELETEDMKKVRSTVTFRDWLKVECWDGRKEKKLEEKLAQS